MDGNKLTVAQIRQGMLDNFFGNDSHSRWKLNEGVPTPAEVVRPGLQGTGPFDDMGMAMSAINAQTASWMPDWEDAGNDYGDQLYSAWRNLKELLAGDWEGRAFAHPVKKKDYQLRVKRESWPTLFIRVPGLHLKNRQMTLDGEAGAGHHSGCGHPCSQQLRFSTTQPVRDLPLCSQDRNTRGSSPRR